jgi:hypothetical protein
LNRGVLYPQSIAIFDGHAELHRTLSIALEPESVPWLDPLRRQWSGTDIVARLVEEAVRSRAKIVVLSAESLAFMHKPELLKRALSPYQSRILVYLRRQDNFLSSFYNQLIKSRLYTATFDGFLQQCANDAIDLGECSLSLAMCRYDRLLDLWGEAFGRQNICVGVYEDYSLPIGMLRDLEAKTGSDFSGCPPPSADTNPALPASLLYLKRNVNRLLSTEQERISLEEVFTSCSLERDISPPPSREEIEKNIARRRAILAPYQDGNISVAKNYFGERRRLFKDPDEHDPLLPDETRWHDPGSEAIRVIARLAAELSRSKQKVAA